MVRMQCYYWVDNTQPTLDYEFFGGSSSYNSEILLVKSLGIMKRSRSCPKELQNIWGRTTKNLGDCLSKPIPLTCSMRVLGIYYSNIACPWYSYQFPGLIAEERHCGIAVSTLSKWESSMHLFSCKRDIEVFSCTGRGCSETSSDTIRQEEFSRALRSRMLSSHHTCIFRVRVYVCARASGVCSVPIKHNLLLRFVDQQHP